VIASFDSAVGSLLLSFSISNRDYAPVQGSLLSIGLSYVLVNPRMR